MNKRHYEHTLPNIRGSLSNTYKQRADKKGRMAAVSGVGRRGSHACVYCSFFSRYSFIASFTMSFSDMFFLMARNFIRV